MNTWHPSAPIEKMWQVHAGGGTLSSEEEAALHKIEVQDSVFPHVDPGLWVALDKLVGD